MSGEHKKNVAHLLAQLDGDSTDMQILAEAIVHSLLHIAEQLNELTHVLRQER